MLIPTPQARWIVRFAAICMLLQVAVPRGYMHADLSSGWYLKLCHQGMTDSAMAALGDGHRHHHHHHHHQHGEQHPDPERDAHESSLCELCQFQLDEVVYLGGNIGHIAPRPLHENPAASVSTMRRHRAVYDSRAPPLQVVG